MVLEKKCDGCSVNRLIKLQWNFDETSGTTNINKSSPPGNFLEIESSIYKLFDARFVSYSDTGANSLLYSIGSGKFSFLKTNGFEINL